MKICLSQIPESERKEYIRQEAERRIYNKMNNKLKYIMEELKSYERV